MYAMCYTKIFRKIFDDIWQEYTVNKATVEGLQL